MMIEKEMKRNREEVEEDSAFDFSEEEELDRSNLTVDQLKSRLNSMNVELDLQRHPKNFYVEMYNEAINDPSKRELIKYKLQEDKQYKVKKNTKNKENLLNNKRHRTEELEKSETVVNLKEEKKDEEELEPILKTKTKHEPVKITVRTVKFDNVMSPQKNSYACKSKEDLPQLLCTPSQNSEKKTITSNIKQYSIKLPAPKFDETESKMMSCAPSNDVNCFDPVENTPQSSNVSESMAQPFPDLPPQSKNNFNRLTNLNPNPSLNFDPVTDKNSQPEQNLHQDSQTIDRLTKLDSKRSIPELNAVRNEKSHINSPAHHPKYRHCKSNNISNFNFNLFNNADHNVANKNHSRNHSNKSQPVIYACNAFRFAQNSIFKNEFIQATHSIRSSTNSLNRVNLLPKAANKHSLNYRQKSGGEGSIEWGKQIKNLFFIIAMGVAGVALWKLLEQKLKNVNFADFPFLNKNTLLIIGFGCLASLLLAYLIHLNRIEKEKANRLIADNCVEEIKALLNERQDYILQQDNFINEYCLTNNRQVEDFSLNVFPFIREIVAHDVDIAETHMNINGNAKAVWKLKQQRFNV